MDDRTEQNLTIASILLLLFSTMLDPPVTLVLAVALLVAFAVRGLIRHRQHD